MQQRAVQQGVLLKIGWAGLWSSADSAAKGRATSKTFANFFFPFSLFLFYDAVLRFFVVLRLLLAHRFFVGGIVFLHLRQFARQDRFCLGFCGCFTACIGFGRKGVNK